jgi:hypothetical protein
MASLRKSIRLFDHERKQLIEHYMSQQIPVDQFESRQRIRPRS